MHAITEGLVYLAGVTPGELIDLYGVSGDRNTLFVDKSLSCLQTSGATAMGSRTGTGTVVTRTQSKRRFGAVSSSRGNKYLNCPWGLKEEVLAESF